MSSLNERTKLFLLFNGGKIGGLSEPRADNKYIEQETRTFLSQDTLLHGKERYRSSTTTYGG